MTQEPDPPQPVEAERLIAASGRVVFVDYRPANEILESYSREWLAGRRFVRP